MGVILSRKSWSSWQTQRQILFWGGETESRPQVCSSLLCLKLNICLCSSTNISLYINLTGRVNVSHNNRTDKYHWIGFLTLRKTSCSSQARPLELVTIVSLEYWKVRLCRKNTRLVDSFCFRRSNMRSTRKTGQTTNLVNLRCVLHTHDQVRGGVLLTESRWSSAAAGLQTVLHPKTGKHTNGTVL